MSKSIQKINKKKEEISKIEKERMRLIKLLFNDCEIVEGSFIDVLVRCGRSGCHCEKEPIHPVTRLSWWKNGKLKNKIVRVADRKRIRMLSNNYKKHKQAMSALVKLNEKEKETIKTVVKLKTIKYK